MNHSPRFSAGLCASEVLLLGTKTAQNAPKRSQISALIQASSPCWHKAKGQNLPGALHGMETDDKEDLWGEKELLALPRGSLEQPESEQARG